MILITTEVFTNKDHGQWSSVTKWQWASVRL